MAKSKNSKSVKAPKLQYGIAEWYGKLYRTLDDTERKRLADTKRTNEQCPFLRQASDLAPKAGTHCSKDGGVCSIRNFVPDDNASDCLQLGEITATCPNRFLEERTIISEIGKLLLGTEAPLVAKELPFLMRSESSSEDSTDVDEEDPTDVESRREEVGKIDLVFVHPNMHPLQWCAVEMQAVYFSGKEMAADFRVIRDYQGNGIPMPGGTRRPDFRSSGPKRLMPQLQIKVPTLRRWGKKMVVVIDKPFFDAMGGMEPVAHISNCDIVWVIVRFDEGGDGKAHLHIHKILFTSLESAVSGLTAGHPTTLPMFEERLKAKVNWGA